MFSSALSLVAGFFASILKDLINDWRRDRALKSAGAKEAALETSKHLQEMSDVQRKNDQWDRGGATDVAKRLRERLGTGGDTI